MIPVNAVVFCTVDEAPLKILMKECWMITATANSVLYVCPVNSFTQGQSCIHVLLGFAGVAGAGGSKKRVRAAARVKERDVGIPEPTDVHCTDRIKPQ